VRYLTSGTDWVSELRGLQMFELLRRQNTMARLSTGAKHGYVHIGNLIDRAPCSDELWFILMPGSSDVVDVIEWRDAQDSMPTIVDVHADVLRLVHNPSDDMIRHGHSVTADAWEWWSDPERQETLTRSLRAADVITTSYAELVLPLRAYNENVVHLPDVQPDSASEFLVGWSVALGLLTR
jgi:hypothetical protein